jgi:hypothetical protein
VTIGFETELLFIRVLNLSASLPAFHLCRSS